MQRWQHGLHPSGEEATELRREHRVNCTCGGNVLAQDHQLGKVAALTRQMQAPVWENCVNRVA